MATSYRLYAVRNGEWSGDWIDRAGAITTAKRRAVAVLGEGQVLSVTEEWEPHNSPPCYRRRCYVARYRSNLPAIVR